MASPFNKAKNKIVYTYIRYQYTLPYMHDYYVENIKKKIDD